MLTKNQQLLLTSSSSLYYTVTIPIKVDNPDLKTKEKHMTHDYFKEHKITYMILNTLYFKKISTAIFCLFVKDQNRLITGGKNS